MRSKICAVQTSCSVQPWALQVTRFFHLCCSSDAAQTSCSAHTCALKIMYWFHVLFQVHKLIAI